MTDLIAENKRTIDANRSKIFELEGAVNHNRALSYMLRSKISENGALITKNYNASFLSNRQLANENTDALFRNRIALMECLPASTEVEANYRQAKINQAQLAVLDHRSALNSQVLQITQEMAAVNALALAVNTRIMNLNELIRDKNSSLIAENTMLITHDHGVPTPENNAALIAANATKIEDIKARVAVNDDTLTLLEAEADAIRVTTIQDSHKIAQRLTAIKSNHDLIAGNRTRIAQLVAESSR